MIENRIEAAGMVMALKAGVHPSSVRRPPAHTTVRRLRAMILATEP